MHIKANNPALQSGQLNMGSQSPALRQREADALPSVGEQLAENLFTRTAPHTLSADDYPDLQAILVALEPAKCRLAFLAGDKDADYTLVLAQDGSAAINEQGMIFLGAGFLRQHKHAFEVLIGAIAHEIGHRPKRIKAFASQRGLTQAQLNALLLQEEILADRFAGKGLAELGVDCEPLIAYLVNAQSPPHPAYLPVEERATLIREARVSSFRLAKARRELFADFDRATNARNHIREL